MVDILLAILGTAALTALHLGIVYRFVALVAAAGSFVGVTAAVGAMLRAALVGASRPVLRWGRRTERTTTDGRSPPADRSRPNTTLAVPSPPRYATLGAVGRYLRSPARDGHPVT
jgi:hypothetical protein